MGILYTGFKGKNNSSCQLLSKVTGEKLYLTNSFDGLKRDIMNVTDKYDLVVMFGLDSNLKDIVRIERVAVYEGVEEKSKTNSNAICRYMETRGVRCCISEVPTQYLCNAAYYHMLRKTDGKAVFIHIPPLKNMSETMMGKIVGCMEEIYTTDFFNFSADFVEKNQVWL